MPSAPPLMTATPESASAIVKTEDVVEPVVPLHAAITMTAKLNLELAKFADWVSVCQMEDVGHTVLLVMTAMKEIVLAVATILNVAQENK